MSENGAVKLNSAQLEKLTKAAFTITPGQGGGCAHAHTNKDFIGKDTSVLAQAAGINIPSGTQLLFGETDAMHPFVQEEQMMPMIPIVRVKSVEEGIALSLQSEHNYKHTAIIHSHDVENITAMARALDTTLFVKNGAVALRPRPRRRRLFEFFDRHADGRRHHESPHVHARPPLRDGG